MCEIQAHLISQNLKKILQKFEILQKFGDFEGRWWGVKSNPISFHKNKHYDNNILVAEIEIKVKIFHIV